MSIVALFASIGEHLPILKKEKYSAPDPEGKINALHYRATVMLILAMTLLVTSTDWISNGGLIDCLTAGTIPDNVINNYCYIMGTFSVPKHYIQEKTDLGTNVAYNGVGPWRAGEDEIDVKLYYQWVPFVLFLQALMFYIPHIIFKLMERDKVVGVIAGLHNWILDDEERGTKETELAKYIVETRGTHWGWCLRVMAASSLYLINVVLQIFFTDLFLGYKFTKYGVNFSAFLEADDDGADDGYPNPAKSIFPRVAKCTFMKFGPSGTLQRHDAQCILPINIINEKIYVFLWFWFCFLALMSALDLIWLSLIIFNKTSWRIILNRKLQTSPRKKSHKVDVKLICNELDFGDWKLIYQVMRNMDALVFTEWMEKLTEELGKKLEEERGNVDTLRLMDLKEKPNIVGGDNVSEKEFLKLDDLGDGNYLTTSSTKESEI